MGAGRIGPQHGLEVPPSPDIDTHCTPTEDNCRALDSAVRHPPGTAKHWQATAMKVFPLLDPCLHCRIFTREREGGKFMV